ncbi:MAG TPA: SGNH/GDSL hydrolase family protein [Thermoanaerobaculia bacterium]|nr:SGNH/GDSL hydrolase family protein [Thermoanaerobaculia bacterium]
MAASPEPLPRARLDSRRQRVLGWVFALGLLFLLLAALEGAVRARMWLLTGSFGPAHRFEHDPASGLRIPVRNQRTAKVRTDSRGFRSPELDDPKPPGRIRLAFAGASNTFCVEASSNEATWPHLVWEGLGRRYPEVSFDYLNAASGGYAVEAIHRSLERRVAPLAPDVVVISFTNNDVVKDTRALARARGLYAGGKETGSWLARHSQLAFFLERNLRIRNRRAEALGTRGRLRFEPREISGVYRDRVAALLKAAQRTAPVVMATTFSYRARRGQSPAEQREATADAFYYMPYLTPETLLAAFEEYNRVVREAARDTGVLLVDLEHAVPGDDRHFADSVHFTDAGCLNAAALISRALADSEAFRRLVRRAAPPPRAT